MYQAIRRAELMAMTTNLDIVRRDLFSRSESFNNSKKNSLNKISNESTTDHLNQKHAKLVSGLQSYQKLWLETLKSQDVSIDTSPAQNVLKAIRPLLDSSGDNLCSGVNDMVSDWEIYDDVCKKLAYMQDNYMDIYAQVTEQYQLYMQDVNTFKASLTSYMDNGTDEIKLNLAGIKDEITKVIDKWQKNPILTVGSKEEADYWQDQLGLSYRVNGANYYFFANLQPMYDIRDSVNKLSSPLSTARFNQWQNSVNSACSTIESDTQIIAQKYSQANTVFNNLAKILSSTMDSLYQTDKEFLRN